MSSSPHSPTFADEGLARDLHASLAVEFGTSAPYHVGRFSLERVGFANLPRLLTTVSCHSADLSAVVPIVRQHAFAWLAERDVKNEHLAFTPSVRTEGRRRRFTDQTGRGRMAEQHVFGFDLSEMLASSVTWSGSVGTLRASWED